jgi:hypothetical protein
LSSGADILERAMISHHVLLTAMCGNFLNTMMIRDAALRCCEGFLNAKIPGSARGMAEPGKLEATHGEFDEDASAISAVMLE